MSKILSNIIFWFIAPIALLLLVMRIWDWIPSKQAQNNQEKTDLIAKVCDLIHSNRQISESEGLSIYKQLFSLGLITEQELNQFKADFELFKLKDLQNVSYNLHGSYISGFIIDCLKREVKELTALC